MRIKELAHTVHEGLDTELIRFRLLEFNSAAEHLSTHSSRINLHPCTFRVGPFSIIHILYVSSE